MAWRWHDAYELRKPDIWRGLRLTASTTGQPGWRVDASKSALSRPGMAAAASISDRWRAFVESFGLSQSSAEIVAGRTR